MNLESFRSKAILFISKALHNFWDRGSYTQGYSEFLVEPDREVFDIAAAYIVDELLKANRQSLGRVGRVSSMWPSHLLDNYFIYSLKPYYSRKDPEEWLDDEYIISVSEKDIDDFFNFLLIDLSIEFNLPPCMFCHLSSPQDCLKRHCSEINTEKTQ